MEVLLVFNIFSHRVSHRSSVEIQKCYIKPFLLLCYFLLCGADFNKHATNNLCYFLQKFYFAILV